MKTLEFPINLPELKANVLKLVVPRIIGKTKVIYNDFEIQKLNNRYSIITDFNKPILITIKNNYFDVVPKVYVNNLQTQIVKPLKWYEYIWMGLPILLAFQGGLIGALLGLSAIRLNSIIFRGNKIQIIKYLQILGINILIVTVFFIIVLTINEIMTK